MPSSEPAAHPAIGLVLPTREDAITGADAHPARLLQLAAHAERVGFDSVWVGDSLLARPRLEPLTLLAAVATCTTDVTIGTAAMTAALRQPVVAAHAIATVDRLTEGRLVLALGAGFPYPDTAAEFDAAGVPFERRGTRLLETVALWRRLWDDDPPEGLSGLPAPSRPGGPPLWYAGAGERAVRRAARHFDGWLPYVPTVEDYEIQARQYVEAASPRGAFEGTSTAALYVTVRVDHDVERARRELDAYCTAYYGAPLELMEALQGFVAGSPSDVAGEIRRFVSAGAEHVVVRIGSLTPDGDDVERVASALSEVRSTEAPDLPGDVDQGVPTAGP
jgi:alkanesulfonate monooxygenase SsuD/methylene tetrahydromethanopterin reductase-like flavin-dependent oxidoreductase (luciferase family)